MNQTSTFFAILIAHDLMVRGYELKKSLHSLTVSKSAS